MRVISQSELLRGTRLELHAMLRRIAAERPCRKARTSCGSRITICTTFAWSWHGPNLGLAKPTGGALELAASRFWRL
jgi:hypothetical protein